MNTYRTSEVAQLFGIHPNTVRLYEELEFLPKPEREENRYRVFNDFHIEQMKLLRIALKIEVLQNGLRKKAIEIIKTSAKGDFDDAINFTEAYLAQVKTEQRNAEEAIAIAANLISGAKNDNSGVLLNRKDAADYLRVTIDTLRNWEMNGLITVKRSTNGYRVYSEEDIRILKIVRSLRCANYSLAAILRMLSAISKDPNVNMREIIDNPPEDDDIISVCDKLITSLKSAEANAELMLNQLNRMKSEFSKAPF